MGSPDNSEEEESTNYSEKSNESKSTKTNEKKKFFRDPDSKVLGGVCAGVSNYFDWDVSIVRLVFALSVLLLGTGFWLYIILWIIIPEAKSTSEKLAMKGKNATVDNISSFVTKVKSSFDNIDTEQIGENIKNQSNKFNDFLVGTSQKFNKTFRPKENGLRFMCSVYSFIGFILMSIGVILLISISFSIFQTNTNEIEELFKEIFSPSKPNAISINLTKTGIYILSIGIAISITLMSIRLAFNKQKELIQKIKPLRIITRFSIIFSLIGLIALIIFNKGSVITSSHLKSHTLDYKTIVIKKLDVLPQHEDSERTKLEIRKTTNKTALLRVAVKVNGVKSLFTSFDEKLYEYEITDSIIELSPYLNSNDESIDKNVDIILFVPDNDSTLIINEFDY